ncbi:response regulator [candidate division KSB3 bacterium]|uniref:histidine kinase n=1 Tax=candidate division KSB3 bacterium TaxID=2044937 RepID=A0A9D5JS54_9BACT|nr:response regulator [candidate division KSB3 bacterium]MBD3323267.1 response regulator [candidate division KSB3 bacterium]
MTKILVVDDDQEIRDKIQTILEYEEFEVLSAENGRRGIEIAKQSVPDLIVCDVIMPAISGFGVLTELRNDSRTIGIPFVFLTGCSAPEEVRYGMTLGADDYLVKPFKTSDLLATIRTRLEKQAAAMRQLESLRLDLSAALPHEFKTPLTAILGFSELLIHFGQQLKPSIDEIIEMQRSVYKNALRLQRLTENYLLYAKLRLMEHDHAQRERWNRHALTVHNNLVLAWVTPITQKHHRQKDIQIKLPAPVYFQVLETDIQKIVQELVENACKFSQPGTPIVITAQFTKEHAALTITDKGRGMTEEQIANIGAYMQFDRSHYEQQGSGLGLAIAKMLARLYQGGIIIESKPAQGTTVTLKLPARDHSI